MEALSLTEKVVGGIIMVLSVLVYYFKGRADSAGTKAIMGETRGEDKQLEKQQNSLDQKIQEVKQQDDSKLTDQERADRWNK